ALAFGARVLSDCKAVRLVRTGKRVTGVEADVVLANGRRGARVTVRAPIVVVSAGAIMTPNLLLRAGVKSPSKQVGKNLTLHPNAKVMALFDETVEGWKGVHQAYQVREFQDEGYLMAAVTVPPAVLAMSLPAWGREQAEIMGDYNRLVSAGILVEDSVTGRVVPLPGGSPAVFYQLSDLDAERIVRGCALLGELLFAAGAREVFMPFEGVPRLRSVDDIRKMVARKIPKRAIDVMTVHIMGTARMPSDPTR